MNKHDKPKTHKIGRIILTFLTTLSIAGIGAGVTYIVTTVGNTQESTEFRTSTTQTSSSQTVQTSSSQAVNESSSEESI